MADISSFTALDGNVYNLKDSVARRHLYEYVRGTHTTPTSMWTGRIDDLQLDDGKQIAYYLPYSGSGEATLNITLANGLQTGAKQVLKNGEYPVTNEYPAYSVIRLTWIQNLDAWVTDYVTSGTIATNYSNLSGKPAIESVELEGNKTFEQLGLVRISNSDIEDILGR